MQNQQADDSFISNLKMALEVESPLRGRIIAEVSKHCGVMRDARATMIVRFGKMKTKSGEVIAGLNDGNLYEFGVVSSESKEPAVVSHQSARAFIIPWAAMLRLAIGAGIDEPQDGFEKSRIIIPGR